MGLGVLGDHATIIERVLQALNREDSAVARDILCAEHPFVPVTSAGRRYTELQKLPIFIRDGFVDRYSGQRLVFPGVFRLLGTGGWVSAALAHRSCRLRGLRLTIESAAWVAWALGFSLDIHQHLNTLYV